MCIHSEYSIREGACEVGEIFRKWGGRVNMGVSAAKSDVINVAAARENAELRVVGCEVVLSWS